MGVGIEEDAVEGEQDGVRLLGGELRARVECRRDGDESRFFFLFDNRRAIVRLLVKAGVDEWGAVGRR